MAYEIIWEPEGVIRQFSGNVSAREFIQSVEQVQGDSRYDEMRYIINDFSAATAAALSVTGEEELWFAGANGPTTSIVSGTPAAVARLVTRLEDEGVFVRRIIADASYGSHCPLMAAAASAEGLISIIVNDPANP